MADEDCEKPFAVERAKTGRAKCKKCKCPIDKDDVRIAKIMANPFGDGKMKAWHHVDCIFDIFGKQRATTKRIENPPEDIAGWDDLNNADQKLIIEKLEEFEDKAPFKGKRQASPNKTESPRKISKITSTSPPKINPKSSIKNEASGSLRRDDLFKEFRRVCADIANVSAYTDKTAVVKKMLRKGADGSGFKGDVVLWCRMLLPMAGKRIYNLQSKQLIKLFSRILRQDEDAMLEDLEQGDVAETISTFFDTSTNSRPCTRSQLTLQEVDKFLENLATLTREDDQVSHFQSIIDNCTANDLKMIIRLIKHDLRINCGPKHILEAIDADAYQAFQVSNNLESVVKRFTRQDGDQPGSDPGTSRSPVKGKILLSLMTPVLPMLAEACTSVEMAMRKCPNGMMSEVKYDGERVQIHKKGHDFKYFSRALKPVVPHKVSHFKDYIPKAFPDGDDLILDSEILLIDMKTGQPLPFGTLGVHKKAQFQDAKVCIFVFDCLYYNGEVLINKTMRERRAILNKRMTVIPNRVMLSEVEEINDSKDLAEMIAKVIKMGLEGLVLKDVNSTYEPGKRHWLKVKRDYLCNGAMADSADLVVLGAWYGTGNKGGIMSIFLMGCYDKNRDKWVTVTKVHGGHDDATLARLQDELDMIKIGKDPNLVPKWLIVSKPMVPDFLARDPKKQPVWEITGAEFTNQGVHTAEGISIRFPRVTRIRDDKDWATATSLDELRVLFKKRTDSIDFSLLLGNTSDTKNTRSKKVKKLDSYNIKRTKEINDGTLADDIKPDVGIMDYDVKNESAQTCGEWKKNDSEGSDNAVFYAFLNNDYIEYSADGRPLNWIEGRKPNEGLPRGAKPLSERGPAEMERKGILGKVRAVISKNIDEEKRVVLSRTLKTLAAAVLEDSSTRSEVTHVIYDRMEIDEGELRSSSRKSEIQVGNLI
ncbi:DNA ligase 3 isoform X2 [Fopius arisanus]|uniref:DNA ligase n=1 Tax=Fopius arisanus TaxID=64838 RepID=A0A9R1TH41_9HYME|nr:PREDICTED: DNA ligase 3 isoform X2 [Fopius arisanus]